MEKYFDSHCHLSTKNVQNLKVGAIYNAAHFSDWDNIIRLSESAENLYGAIGIHPWYVSDLPNNWFELLKNKLTENQKLMVGEIGLDKHHDNMDLQIDIFAKQLLLAHELNRPVQLHCVGAWEKMLAILKMYRNKLPSFIIAHEYSGPHEIMQRLVSEYNFFFSYGPRNLRNPLRILATPMGRILSETDGDNPDGVISVVEQMAEILNIAPKKMADIIYKNTMGFLRHDQTA